MTPLLLALPGDAETARAIAARLGGDVTEVSLHRFPDGESLVRIEQEIRERSVSVVATLDRPDPKLIPLLFLANTARRLGATRVGLVAPYLPYLRQDHSFRRGEAVSSLCLGRLLSRDFDWLVTVDPHLHRHHSLDAVLSIPARAVAAAPTIATWLRTEIANPLLIGPDAESRQWVSEVARHVDAPYIVLEKNRLGDREVEISVPEGVDLRDCTPVVIDDVASTAGTLIAVVRTLLAAGAAAPVCVVVHGLFVDDADLALRRAGARAVVSCNTVAHATNTIDLSAALASAVRGFFPQ